MPKYYNLSIKNLQYRLRRFKSIVQEELTKIILENENIIVEMITDEQLYERGIEGRGIEIMSYAPYTRRTISIKIQKGQPTDRVTLRDTGKFHKSLRIEFDDKGFYIVSSDEKSKYLLKKYGNTIVRLTDENLKSLLSDFIRPQLKQRIRERILNG